MFDKLIYIFFRIIRFTFLRYLLSDELYIKLLYRWRLGYWPNLKSPKTFNEKLQWLKLHNRKPEYTQMADKFAVREYIAKTIGDEYLIPLLGVWDKFEDIDFEKLPNQFVLKCTHNSGGNIICKDKIDFNIRNARRKINWWLKHNYFYAQREYPYKNIKPRIIAEQYMVDESGIELKDYKVWCFNGEPKFLSVNSERYSIDGLKVTYFDFNWNELPFIRHYPKSTKGLKKPKFLEDMNVLSKILSDNTFFLRVDWYIAQEKLFFGELTFFPLSGYGQFIPSEWGTTLGSWIELSAFND